MKPLWLWIKIKISCLSLLDKDNYFKMSKQANQDHIIRNKFFNVVETAARFSEQVIISYKIFQNFPDML